MNYAKSRPNNISFNKRSSVSSETKEIAFIYMSPIDEEVYDLQCNFNCYAKQRFKFLISWVSGKFMHGLKFPFQMRKPYVGLI